MKLTLDAFTMRVCCLPIISAQPMSSFRVQQNYQKLQQVLQVPILLHHGLAEGGLNACICLGQDVIRIDLRHFPTVFLQELFSRDIFEERMGKRPYSFPDLSQGEASRGNQPSRDRGRVCLASLLTILSALDTRKSEKQSPAPLSCAVVSHGCRNHYLAQKVDCVSQIGLREGLERF